MADQMVELRENISQSSLYNKDLAPTLLKQRTWNTYNLCRPVDRHGPLHTHIHACRRPHRPGDELEGSIIHHYPRQPHRPDPHAPQRPPGDEVRHSFSDSGPGILRRFRGQYSGAPSCRGRVRLVRHQDFRRRRRRQHAVLGVDPRMENHGWKLHDRGPVPADGHLLS